MIAVKPVTESHHRQPITYAASLNVVHNRRTHTALVLLCSEWYSVGQNLLSSCFDILLNNTLGWEISCVFFPLFTFAGFPLYTGQSLTQY